MIPLTAGHGRHCATHQIRIILISCVVITSLFYPALAIYSSSQPQSWSTTQLLRSLAGNAVSSWYAQDDLHNLWEGHSAIRLRDDAVSRARCGVERTLRVERVLIGSPIPNGDGTINNQCLLSTLQFERQIGSLLASRNVPCLKRLDGHCFVLSPLVFWHHDEAVLLADRNILDTLNLSKNISVSGVPVTPQMVLAGRGSQEQTNFEYAEYLALTYFFLETGRDCLEVSDHTLWLQIVEIAAAQSLELAVQSQEPTLIALEVRPLFSLKGHYQLMIVQFEQNRSKTKLTPISAFIYLAYTTFFAYVVLSMRRMDSVHSRIGLTFTALVEITVSTVTSLSVCALGGFKVTMVPW